MTKMQILGIIRRNKAELGHFGIARIGLFGSYSRGNANAGSDIDILIEFQPEGETFDNLMAVYDYLERIFEKTKVGIVTQNGLSPHIGPKILQEVIYA
ncbi:MAG: nucleotidyltransferase family protein [Bacteroidetes bacterium]|nr:nucleotidyltransferase family protein [Bacteroidota bacterium]MBU1719288.1 nucleotidyltransferase family protein [Bacteroidota bacterium]